MVRPQPTKIQLLPSAVSEGGAWYGAVEFRLGTQPLGAPLVLRERPCRTTTDALRLARQYIDATDRSRPE
jgi:hypothetical protein